MYFKYWFSRLLNINSEYILNTFFRRTQIIIVNILYPREYADDQKPATVPNVETLS